MRTTWQARRGLRAGLVAGMLLSALSVAAHGESKATLPLIDGHVHYNDLERLSVSPKRALELFDRAGVRMAVVSSTSSKDVLALHRAAPDRIIPVLRPYRTPADEKTWFRDETIPPYLAEKLRSGIFEGIGEFHVYGDDAALPVVEALVDMAAERGLVLHIHGDAAAVGHLFARDPDARVLLAHAGYADAEGLRALFRQHEKLWADLSMRADIAEGGRLLPEWRQLFIDHADRFLIGSDTYASRRWFALPQIIGDIRAWLATLPPEVAEKLAWRNAARLFGVGQAELQALSESGALR